MARYYKFNKDLLRLMDKNEGAGGWDTLYGHRQRKGQFAGTDVSKMTVGEVMQFTDPSGPYAQSVKNEIGRVATPTGRFQIVGQTLRKSAKDLGLSPDTPYNAETQLKIADHLLNSRLSGAQSDAEKLSAMRAEWHGFKNVPDAVLLAALDGAPIDPSAIGASPTQDGATATVGVGASPAAATANVDMAPTSETKDEPIIKLPKILPDKVFGVDTKKQLNVLGSLGEMIAKQDQAMNQQISAAAQAGAARRGNAEPVQIKQEAAPLFGASAVEGIPRAQGINPDEIEALKRKMLMARMGGLGGFGGYGRA